MTMPMPSIWGNRPNSSNSDDANKNNQQNNNNHQNNQGGGNNNNQNDNNNNNEDPNARMIDDIWKDIETKKDDNSGNNGNNQNNQNNQNQNDPNNQSDPQKDVDAYLAKVGLGDFKLTEAELEAFKTGDGVQGVLDNLNKRIRDSHISAITSANKLMDKKIEAAVDAAVGKSKSFYQGEQLRSLLQERLPWTKDTAIAPMAETVLRQLLTKGASYEQGIKGVEQYFQRVQKAMDPGYEPPNSNTRQPFRGQKQEQGNQDWIKILSPSN